MAPSPSLLDRRFIQKANAGLVCGSGDLAAAGEELNVNIVTFAHQVPCRRGSGKIVSWPRPVVKVAGGEWKTSQGCDSLRRMPGELISHALPGA